MEILKSCFDWFVIYIAYAFLRLRWAYFHVSPTYAKFWMTDTESHFQNLKTGEIHSDVRIHLKNGRVL